MKLKSLIITIGSGFAFAIGKRLCIKRVGPTPETFHTLHGTVATARYTSPDPMQPSKGVLAAAAVRELKVFIENSVLMNDSPFKVCRCQRNVRGRAGVDFCTDGENWVRAVRGSRVGECIFGLGETHTAMATAKTRCSPCPSCRFHR